MSDERPWLTHYPKGIPANIDPDVYPNIPGFLEDVMARYKKNPAFTNMGKTITFQQLDNLSNRFGAYLISRGLKPGDKIAIMMPNLLQYPVALFGALKAGLIVVNTNPLYTPREMRHQFTDADVKAIVIAENFAANLEKVLPDTQINTIILTSIGEMLGFFKRIVVNFAVRYIKRMVPSYQIENTVSFSEALKQGKKFTLTPHDSAPDDTILLQYTGGTTGIAKGTMLTNRNIIANMEQIKALMIPYLNEAEEVVVCPLPMYHIFAFTVNILAMMRMGNHTVLITNARDLKSVVKVMKKFPISLMTGVNTLFNALLNEKSFRKLDLSSLKVTVAGGMALQRTVAEEWQAVTGCPLSEGYGMTEASPVVSCNPLDGSGKLGSIGLPVPSTDMRVVDENGNLLGTGKPGEIEVKGPQVMKGYYNRPDETDQSLHDGWFRTGDIGMMHEDGYFEIVDRKKDMINVSGFNVYPNEVEEVVVQHPKVLEAAAIGIPDSKSGEVVKLFVVKKEKSLTKDELIAYCRENLTGYKIPKEVVFKKELPKTNVGKILRRALKDEESEQ